MKKDIGFFDLEIAKKTASLRKAHRAQTLPTYTWRDVERILIPGYLINLAIRAITPRLPLVGPEIVKWLEQRVERLSGIECAQGSLNSYKSAQMSLMQWLLQAPNNEPEPKEEETSLGRFSLADAFEQSDLRLEIPVPVFRSKRDREQSAPISPQSEEASLRVPLDHTTPKAH